MYLIQLFLPLQDNEGDRFGRQFFEQVEQEFIRQFDGFTAYPRAPASGLWRSEGDDVQRDALVVYEVMTEKLEKEWWEAYRRKLESQFQQERILIRCQTVEVL
jgi:hypothetical protein